jgi:hypothetical protein
MGQVFALRFDVRSNRVKRFKNKRVKHFPSFVYKFKRKAIICRGHLISKARSIM